MANKNFTRVKPRTNARKYDLYHTSKPGDLPLGYEWVPAKIAKPALISQVTMQDHSMSPIFWPGDELTIDTEKEVQSGYYLLIQLGKLLLVRRFIYRESEPDRYEGSLGERTIVDDKGIVKQWGVVTTFASANVEANVLKGQKPWRTTNS
jgi:hypothetical protein